MFLSSLGISPIQQGKPPTVDGFPLMFNPETRNLWALAVEATKDVDVVKNHTRWTRCINYFIDLCVENDKYVFDTTSANDRILELLSKARLTAVHYINKYSIIDVDANVALKDPTFPEYLINKCLFKTHLYDEHSREAHLPDGVSFYYVNRGTSQRIHFGYRITIPMFPRVPDSSLPKKQELEDFILNILWMPVLKSHRPLKLAHRLL